MAARDARLHRAPLQVGTDDRSSQLVLRLPVLGTVAVGVVAVVILRLASAD